MQERNQNYRWQQASFAGGIYGAQLYGRDDLDRYAIGSKEMRNFYPYPYGGFSRRMGTFFVNEVKYSNKHTRLIPFIYSDKTAFMLEVGEKYIRVYRDGGIVMNGDSPVEIETPYLENELDSLKYVQSADRMYIVHGNHHPKTLTRYSDTNWKLENVTIAKGPFEKQNSTSTTMYPSARSGHVILTASAPVFKSTMVGSLIKLSQNIYGQVLVRHDAGGNYTSSPLMCNGGWKFTVTDPATMTITIQVSNDNGLTWQDYRSYSLDESYSAVTDSGNIDHQCLMRVVESASSNGTADYYFSCDPFIANGFATITSILNNEQAEADVYTDNNEYMYGFASTKPTMYWSIGAFNDEYGYPSTIAFYQDRLYYGSTKHSPLSIWGSVVGDYDNFYVNETPKDADAVSYSLNSGSINQPKSMISMRILLAFTSSSEWQISGGASGNAITPSNILAVQQSSHGICDLDPIMIEDRALFVPHLANSVRDIAYDYSLDSYRGDDQTLYNRDLFENHSIISWCKQTSPDNLLWVVRDDGKLLSLTYVYTQKVCSWARHDTDGNYEVAASIPGKKQDEVYFIVKRKINGRMRRYIEIMAHKEDKCYLDCASRGTFDKEIKTVRNMDYLEGRAVTFVGDNSYAGEGVVSNGTVELNYPVKKVILGLPYESDFKTLDIQVPRQDGTSFGRNKKLSHLIVKVKDTFGGMVGVNNYNRMMPIKMAPPPIIGGVPEELSGDYKVEPASGYEPNAYITIKQDKPYPMTVLKLCAEVAIG